MLLSTSPELEGVCIVGQGFANCIWALGNVTLGVSLFEPTGEKGKSRNANRAMQIGSDPLLALFLDVDVDVGMH